VCLATLRDVPPFFPTGVVDADERLLAKALAPEVRVNAIAPGNHLPCPVVRPEWETDFIKLAHRTFRRSRQARRHLLMRAFFLAQSEFVTGQVLNASMGQNAVALTVTRHFCHGFFFEIVRGL